MPDKKNDIMKKIAILSLFAAVLFSQSSINCAYSQVSLPEDQVTVSVYEAVNPTIVAIDVDIPDGTSSGTGCIIDPRGIILTSSHVIEDPGKIEVTLANGKKYMGKLIAITGENNDLALIKINCETPLPVIRLGDSTKIKVGQRVLAIGNPFGFNGTLTTGIISRIDRERNKIQTDAAINPGCSGGPLLNTSGEVIGISQSIYNPDNNKSNIGIGFAVPVNAAKRFITKVRTDYNPRYPASNRKASSIPYPIEAK